MKIKQRITTLEEKLAVNDKNRPATAEEIEALREEVRVMLDVMRQIYGRDIKEEPACKQ
ncbi:hypothetical protein [Desulfotomaculum copahuensis]|uniref:hypothetical protein n=1 Tax=Desulfotomaculum copahuensis TaxID=1838280 RepID=UPI000AA207A7|nr:hypothetical protein [Desulfotomaculum copahuensis]